MITGMIIGFVIKMIFIYFIAMHGLYLLLIWIGATELKRYHQGIAFGEFQRISHSPLSLPVSVVIPAYNEERMILNTVMNMLRLHYPQYEVIVVNDGSKDRTLQVLIEHFNLRRIDKVYKKHFETQPIRGFYQSLEYPNLLVIDKENGRRADAVNAGLNLVRYPLICQTDADCVLEEDALLRMARPFLLNSNVIAATAFIRPSNGIVVDQGRILERGLPKGWLPLFQVVEYLRSFQWARSGLTRLKSMLCMPGGYTVVRKDIYLKVGGANAKAVVDDFELTVTLHRYVHEHKQEGPLELAYVPDPGCYTEVPERLRGYASQRNFWQRAILQSLIWNRDMALNPRYGLAGMFGFPFYFLFEGISALVEGLAYTMAPIAYFTGKASLTEMVLLFIFGVVLGAFVSVCAVLMQERTRMRQAKTRNLIRLLTAGFLEHFGYHQFHVLCRIIGIYDLLIRHRIVYGFRERHGYQSPV
jgi:cellulose synthase/poly-beta-1,6-N-acetylglucosamine synthase-like glycosyltransferase